MNRLMSGPVSKSVLVCSGLLLAFSLGAQESTQPAAATAAATQTATEATTTAAPAVPAKPPSLSNKWRMEVSGDAKSDGAVVLRITPKGGESITVEIPIAKKTGENDVAKVLVKGLKAQLDKKKFHVERDDGEDVLVKKKGRTPDFALELVSSTVAHTRINIEKE